MDYVDLVHKIDYLVQSSLLSSLVFTLIQEFDLLPHSKGLKVITYSLYIQSYTC